MWFIGVEVEQETSVPPPPKKNPGSAPVDPPKLSLSSKTTLRSLRTVFKPVAQQREHRKLMFSKAYFRNRYANVITCIFCEKEGLEF